MTNLEKLRETFPKTIFIFRKNGNDETAAIMCSDEWLQGDYDQMYKDAAPCEDAVSRDLLLENVRAVKIEGKYQHVIFWNDIKDLPPVTPKQRADSKRALAKQNKDGRRGPEDVD